MASEYTCPGCSALLKTADPLPVGRLIKCPKCSSTFPVPGEDATVVGGMAPLSSHRVREEQVDDWSEADHPDYQSLHRSRRRPPPKSNTPVLLGVLLVALLCAGAGFLLYWFNFRDPGLGPAAEPLEEAISYLPANGSILVGIHAEDLLKNPEVVQLLDKHFQADGKDFHTRFQEHTGLDLSQVQYLALALNVSPEALELDEESLKFTLVVQTKMPAERAPVLKALGADQPPRNLEGKEIYEGTIAGTVLKLYFPSKHFLVLSSLTDDEFKPVLQADGKRTKVAADVKAMLQKMDRCQVWMVVALSEDGRNQALKDKPMPKAVNEVLNTSRAAGVWLQVEESKLKANFGLLCKDAATASKRAEEWRPAIDGLKIEAARRMNLLGGQNPGAQEVVQELSKSVTVRTDGELVTVFAQAPFEPVITTIVNLANFFLR